MKYLSKFEFNNLSDTEKQEYYEELRNEKNQAVTPDKMEEVGAAYEAIAGYYNASEFASDMRKAASRARAEEEKYRAEKRKKGLLLSILAVAIVVIVAVIVVVTSMVSGKAKSYAEAEELYQNKRYAEAKEIFESLGDYENSKLYIIAINGELNKETFNGVGVRDGDTVEFGAYQTEGDETADPIAWIVVSIDKENGKALLLSRDIIEYSAFGGENWKDSTIREWLNGEFYTSAFSDDDKNKIFNTFHGEYKGEDDSEVVYECTDFVMLVSEDDYAKYLASYDGTVKSSAYTEAVSDEIGDSGNGEWLLSTVTDSGNVLNTTESGSKSAEGIATDAPCGIRPMIWVALDKK